MTIKSQKHVKFGDRKIGDGEPCFIVFEAGPAHSGIDSAKRLVTHAAEAGADAIKFQMLDPDRLIADKKQLFSFEILINRENGQQKTISKPLYDLLKERSLTRPEWSDL